MPDSIVSDLLKESWKVNIKSLSSNYKMLLDPRKYSEAVTFTEMNKVFSNRTYHFKARLVSAWDPKKNMVIFNPKSKTT